MQYVTIQLLIFYHKVHQYEGFWFIIQQVFDVDFDDVALSYKSYLFCIKILKKIWYLKKKLISKIFLDFVFVKLCESNSYSNCQLIQIITYINVSKEVL